MISWSMPAKLSPNMLCHEVVHPSSTSCVKNILRIAGKTCKGAGLFFLLFQSMGGLRSLVMARRRKDEYSWKAFGNNVLRFQIFCICIASGTLGLSCFFRNLIGRYWRSTTVFLPATISGLSSCLMDPKTRLLGAIMLTNSVLALFWKRMATAAGIRVSNAQKTAIFMLLSSIVSALIVKSGNNPPFWFFNPLVYKKGECSKTPPSPQQCYHPASCSYHIMSNLSSYFLAGLSITFIKFLFKNGSSALSHPRILFRFFTQPSSLSMAVFCGLYSSIFQATRCTMTKTEGCSSSDSALSLAAAAGFLAGSSFSFYPSTSIFNFAIITASQVIFDELSRKGSLPEMSYSTVAFALASGYLFDAAFLCLDCPAFPMSLINSATSGEGAIIAKHIRSFLI